MTQTRTPVVHPAHTTSSAVSDPPRDPGWLLRSLLKDFKIDPDREGLNETPRRFHEAMAFWLSGYDQNPKDVMKTFKDGSQDYDEMVVLGGIPVYSLCEHHLAPFFGVAHIAYIPNPDVGIIGLSKLPRLVDIFARRLQVQERLGNEIASAMQEHLKPIGVGVVMRCRHLCMESRGVQKAGIVTYTSKLLGAIKDKPEARSEFMRFVRMADEQSGRI